MLTSADPKSDVLAQEPEITTEIRDSPRPPQETDTRLEAHSTPVPSQPASPVAQSKPALPIPPDMPINAPSFPESEPMTLAPEPSPRKSYRPAAPVHSKGHGMPFVIIAAGLAVVIAGYAASRTFQRPSVVENTPLTEEMSALKVRCDRGFMPACIDLLSAYDDRNAPGDEARKKEVATTVVNNFGLHCRSGDSDSCAAAADLISRYDL